MGRTKHSPALNSLMKILLILALCGATVALAGDQIKKFEIKYAIKTSPTRIIIVESTDSYQA